MITKFNAKLIENFKEYDRLSKKYDLSIGEILQIDLNRCGIYLENGEVRIDFRVRFKGQILDDYETWYALPSRNKGDTPFSLKDSEIYCFGTKIGTYKDIYLDTCESSYQRGLNLLNLNSRSRSSCGGCTACVHNYHNFYDSTVLKDKKQLFTENDIENFYNEKNIVVASLVQIAVVTGLFKNENETVEHLKRIKDVSSKRGFDGELMYFGCQINSDKALKDISDLGNVLLIYALDNFTKREMLLSKTKSLITIETARDTLLRARTHGINTSISYISGIDSLKDMRKGFTLIKDSITRFPIINIYQIQTPQQAKILNEEAFDLEFYLRSRQELENIFKDTDLKPKRWENYRPLWYKYYNNEELPNNAFGQLEKIKRRVNNGRID